MPYSYVPELTNHRIERVEIDGDRQIIFHRGDGKRVKMWHEQDCCERVWLEDGTEDLRSIENGTFILSVEEITEHDTDCLTGDSSTWTFYKFVTFHGSFTLRWCGSSNGYYSETVDIEIME